MGNVLNVIADVLATVAFIWAWVYCYREGIGPIEFAERLAQRVRERHQ